MNQNTKIKKAIAAARRKSEQYQSAVATVFEEIRMQGASTEVPYSGVNASNLDEAITCYIDYGEGDLADILKALENSTGGNHVV